VAFHQEGDGTLWAPVWLWDLPCHCLEHRIAKKKQHHKLRSIHQIIQIHPNFTK
jgi:hypothetical protein